MTHLDHVLLAAADLMAAALELDRLSPEQGTTARIRLIAEVRGYLRELDAATARLVDLRLP